MTNERAVDVRVEFSSRRNVNNMASLHASTSCMSRGSAAAQTGDGSQYTAVLEPIQLTASRRDIGCARLPVSEL